MPAPYHSDIIKTIYSDTDPQFYDAASLSVLAHLENLIGSGKAITDGDHALDGIYCRIDSLYSDGAAVTIPSMVAIVWSSWVRKSMIRWTLSLRS